MTNKNLISLRVHIVPIGYEVDRIIVPLEKMKADKIIFINHSKTDLGLPYFDFIKKYLIENNIIKLEKIENIVCDVFELWNCLNQIAKLVNREESDNNTIFFNVSSGSKIISMAGMLIMMMSKMNAYYVVPERYNSDNISEKITPLSSGCKDIFLIPRFPIVIPNINEIHYLNEIDQKIKQNRKDYIEIYEAINILYKINPEIREKHEQTIRSSTRGYETKAYNIFKRNYESGLVSKKYIDIEFKRPYKIRITEDGHHILDLFSNLFGLSKEIVEI